MSGLSPTMSSKSWRPWRRSFLARTRTSSRSRRMPSSSPSPTPWSSTGCLPPNPLKNFIDALSSSGYLDEQTIILSRGTTLGRCGKHFRHVKFFFRPDISSYLKTWRGFPHIGETEIGRDVRWASTCLETYIFDPISDKQMIARPLQAQDLHILPNFW